MSRLWPMFALPLALGLSPACGGDDVDSGDGSGGEADTSSGESTGPDGSTADGASGDAGDGTGSGGETVGTTDTGADDGADVDTTSAGDDGGGNPPYIHDLTFPTVDIPDGTDSMGSVTFGSSVALTMANFVVESGPVDSVSFDPTSDAMYDYGFDAETGEGVFDFFLGCTGFGTAVVAVTIENVWGQSDPEPLTFECLAP